MSTDRIYCSYFDHNYLTRGLALYYSLQRHAPGSRLWVLCLSEECHKILHQLKLTNLVPVPLAEFELADPELAATRVGRSTIEYYFTCSPAWMLYVRRQEPSAEWITYLDGDLYFFSPPEPIYDELKGASAAIIPHRYPAKLSRLKKFGIYNVGWVGARTDAEGLAVIVWWREKCIEWCHDVVDGDRFADQGYLNHFLDFPGVRIIDNVGANLAPWNIGNYAIECAGDDVFVADGRPLIFFHFQGLRKGLCWFVFTSHRSYRAPLGSITKKHIYKPYIDEILAIEAEIDPIYRGSLNKPHRRSSAMGLLKYLKNNARKISIRTFQLLDIVTGRAFVIRGNKAY